MMGVQKSAASSDQTHEPEAGVWRTLKDTFDDLKFNPGMGGQ
jgi:hypothetical protein